MLLLLFLVASALVWATAFFCKYNTDFSRKQNAIYIASSIAVAIVCLVIEYLATRNTYRFGIVVGIAFFALSMQLCFMLYSLVYKKKSIASLIIMSVKLAIMLCILLLYQYLFRKDSIGHEFSTLFAPLTAYSTMITLSACTALLLYDKTLFSKLPSVAKMLYPFFLAITPVLLYIIVEFSYNTSASSITFQFFFLNLYIYIYIVTIFHGLIPTRNIGLILLYILAFVAGVVSHFLVVFRGSPLQAVDLFSIGTAISVANAYKYDFTDSMAFTLLLLIIAICFLIAIGDSKLFVPRDKKRSFIIHKAISIVSIILLNVYISGVDFVSKYNIPMDTWTPITVYQYTGFAPAFTTFLQEMKIEKPTGYSAQSASSILSQYSAVYDGGHEEAPSDERPTIIVIMNEAFSDLSTIAPLDCTDEHLEFLYSLETDPHVIAYGSNYVSTIGGGTAITEYEFLTGSSLFFTPVTVPYATFNFTNVPTIVSQLKSYGYHTIAMHPENKSNWRRNIVYSQFGFDEMIFLDEFEGYDRTIYNRISDAGNYEKLIEVYESQTEPAFIFNITMQNHGSYMELHTLPEDEIVEVDEEYSEYEDFIMYESLINKADEALEDLIEYFESVDEPVIICFFGDHQPSLSITEMLVANGRTADDTDLSATQKKFVTPYFIWTNMDTSQDEGRHKITSANYLSALVLKYSGLELSDFDKFRLSAIEDIPAVNTWGYIDSSGTWHSSDEYSDEHDNGTDISSTSSSSTSSSSLTDILDDYAIINYNILFDTNHVTNASK